jgi:hypothetical protein
LHPSRCRSTKASFSDSCIPFMFSGATPIGAIFHETSVSKELVTSPIELTYVAWIVFHCAFGELLMFVVIWALPKIDLPFRPSCPLYTSPSLTISPRAHCFSVAFGVAHISAVFENRAVACYCD